ncbi:MAG TPA: 3-isopropylmalate dehydratase small subunit [Usitatibacter sp.]|nr:3-isopropylmalate dehydratase small subunit [Usitatibacter sp.]
MTSRAFTTLRSIAAPLPQPNIDTDAILPARFLKRIEVAGLGKALFHDWRYTADGGERPEFVLNQPAYRDARILVAGANFGCGSSRENAVWALYDHGIRCVIAPSFGDIFYGNAVGYGLLPVVLGEDDMRRLLDAIAGAPAEPLEVDLPAQRVRFPGGGVASFAIDAAAKNRLVNGLDEIALTLEREPEIAAFEERRRRERPWLYPAP